MKTKFCSVLIAFAFMVVVVGCGQKNETKVFVKESDGVTVKAIYTYKEDHIITEKIEAKLDYSLHNIDGVETAKEMFGSTLEGLTVFNDVKGYHVDIQYEDDYLMQTVEVDYSVANLEELDSKVGYEIPFAGEEENKYPSMNAAADILLGQGFSEAEK